jgi:hypothetical protein
VKASALEIVTPEPGWTVELYGARSGPPKDFPAQGWDEIGGGEVAKRKQRFRLDTDRSYRYYLAWITDLGNGDRVQIDEIQLFQRKAAR